MLNLRTLALAASTTMALAAPALAQETFAISGSDIGSAKDDYTGKVVTTKNGQVWTVVWTLKDGDVIQGTGIALPGCCWAASGLYKGKPFVFLLKADGAKYVGVWTIAGETQVGRETWIPQ